MLCFVHSIVYAFGRVINITLSGLFELGFKWDVN